MINVSLKGENLIFNTDKGLFSPDGIDKGTLAMLSFAEFLKGDKVLDLGCGYGAVGILAARLIGQENVVMSDINQKAVEMAAENAELNGVAGIKTIMSDGFDNITDTGFSLILSNPPYHADFSVPKKFIEKGFNRLKLGGKMYMVSKRKDWYKNKLTAIFGGVKIYEADGYYVLVSEKRGLNYANIKQS